MRLTISFASHWMIGFIYSFVLIELGKIDLDYNFCKKQGELWAYWQYAQKWSLILSYIGYFFTPCPHTLCLVLSNIKFIPFIFSTQKVSKFKFSVENKKHCLTIITILFGNKSLLTVVDSLEEKCLDIGPLGASLGSTVLSCLLH